MNDAMSEIEALAKLKAARLENAKTAMERAVVTGSGSPETDYLLEKGYVKVGSPNAHHRWSATSMFLTKSGKAWIHADGGPMRAMIVVGAYMRAAVQEAA